MTDSSRPIRIKVIRKSTKASPDKTESLLWGDCLFCTDAAMTDYDWVLVYDELPRNSIGTIKDETEPLLCPPDQTILITVEPPSIKIYSRAYTGQFGTVLTTHSVRDLPHPNHTLGRGCLEWLYIKPMQEILDQTEFPKTKMLSTICSAKQHTHTMHKMRYDLTRYLADHLPELDWFGHGIQEIENKTVAMDGYKYHLCVENHLEPHHWTEKLSDAFVAMTLPFYAGDPLATECFPQESFIPIPLDDPQKAFEIIRKAMDGGEYEKRLPAIREARRLVLEKYNMFAQTAAVIHNHRGTGTVRPGATLKGRHVLRKNPLNALRELADTLPVVVLGNPIPGINCRFLQRERGRGVFASVSYLSDLGHKRIAFVGGEDGVDITLERLAAYRQALAVLGLPEDEELVALSDYYAPDGFAAANRLLSRGTDFTAILAMNDNVAVGVYRALADAGLEIPRDVSVISCDQFFTAEYMVPRLTSVDQHNALFGQFVIKALLSAMEGGRENVLLRYDPELIIRESCMPPAQKENKENQTE